jgi:hypothetical protein
MSAAPRKRPLTEKEIVEAAYHTTKSEGLLPPESLDDVKLLEEEFGVFPKGGVAFSQFTAFVTAQQSPDHPKPAPSEEAALKCSIHKELGIAARKGAAIPPEIWNLMMADREAVEKKTKGR